MSDLRNLTPPPAGHRAICPLCSEAQGWPDNVCAHLVDEHKRTREQILELVGIKEGDLWPEHLWESGGRLKPPAPHSKPICEAPLWAEARLCLNCGHTPECHGLLGHRGCVQEEIDGIVRRLQTSARRGSLRSAMIGAEFCSCGSDGGGLRSDVLCPLHDCICGKDQGMCPIHNRIRVADGPISSIGRVWGGVSLTGVVPRKPGDPRGRLYDEVIVDHAAMPRRRVTMTFELEGLRCSTLIDGKFEITGTLVTTVWRRASLSEVIRAQQRATPPIWNEEWKRHGIPNVDAFDKLLADDAFKRYEAAPTPRLWDHHASKVAGGPGVGFTRDNVQRMIDTARDLLAERIPGPFERAATLDVEDLKRGGFVLKQIWLHHKEDLGKLLVRLYPSGGGSLQCVNVIENKLLPDVWHWHEQTDNALCEKTAPVLGALLFEQSTRELWRHPTHLFGEQRIRIIVDSPRWRCSGRSSHLPTCGEIDCEKVV